MSSLMRGIILAVFSTAHVGLCRAAPESIGNDLPIIELRLAPSTQAISHITSGLSKLATSRHAMEERMQAELEHAAATALERCHAEVKALLGSGKKAATNNLSADRKLNMPGFLSAPSDRSKDSSAFAVKVNLLPTKRPSAAVLAQLARADQLLSVMEGQTLRQAIEEMGEITNVVVNELAASLNTLPKMHARRIALADGSQANVRVAAAANPFPTIGALFEDLESRLDSSGSKLIARALQLEKELLHAEMTFVSEALRHAAL